MAVLQGAQICVCVCVCAVNQGHGNMWQQQWHEKPRSMAWIAVQGCRVQAKAPTRVRSVKHQK